MDDCPAKNQRTPPQVQAIRQVPRVVEHEVPEMVGELLEVERELRIPVRTREHEQRAGPDDRPTERGAPRHHAKPTRSLVPPSQNP